MKQQVEIEFDRGTLLLGSDTGPLRREYLARLPGALWDPRVQQYRCPAFLYREVVSGFRRLGFDCREPLWRTEVALPPLEGPPLRPYQQGAVVSHVASGGRGLVVLPTGAGKTRVAHAILSGVESCLCLVPTRTLLHQWRNGLLTAGVPQVGLLGDGHRELQAVTVTTFESAYRHMARIGNRFQLLIVDEVHHFGGRVRDEALEMCMAPLRLGLTATPPDEENLKRLQPLMGKVVFERSLSELRGEYLADFDQVLISLPLTVREQKRYDTDYAVFSLALRTFRRAFPGADFADFQAVA